MVFFYIFASLKLLMLISSLSVLLYNNNNNNNCYSLIAFPVIIKPGNNNRIY